MANKNVLFDWIGSFAFGEAMEGIFPKLFDRVNSKEKDASASTSDPKGEKASIGGFGNTDERLFIQAVRLARKEGLMSMDEINLFTEFLGEIPIAHSKAIIRLIGHKESPVKISETPTNADGSVFDPNKVSPNKKGPPPKPAGKIVVQEMRNNDGKEILLHVADVIRHACNYAPPQTKTFTAQEKTKAKKAIHNFFYSSRIIRDFSDQVQEGANEAEQAFFALSQKLGFDHKDIDEMRASSEDFLRKAKIKRLAAEARARR